MRLTSSLWVAAYLRRCACVDVPAVVERRGDMSAGTIFIKVDLLNGTGFLFAPAPQSLLSVDGARGWIMLNGGEAVSFADLEAYMIRELEFDPDLWIVVLEDRMGRHFLEDEFLGNMT